MCSIQPERVAGNNPEIDWSCSCLPGKTLIVCSPPDDGPGYIEWRPEGKKRAYQA